MPANGRRQLANAFATLRVLRRELSCRLPVELVYHGDAGMPSDLRLLFEVRHAPCQLHVSAVLSIPWLRIRAGQESGPSNTSRVTLTPDLSRLDILPA